MKEEIISLKKYRKMNWWLRSTKRFFFRYIEQFLILLSAVIGCISISAFASLVFLEKLQVQ